MKNFYLTFILAIIALCQAYAQSTIYVNSSTGNDATGNGSSGNPYKTFHKGYTMASSGDILDLTGTFTWTDADETGDATTTGYTISKNLTIQGQGADQTIIQAAATENTADRRIFTPSSGYTVTIQNLKMRYGYISNSSGGAALRVEGTATLNLNNCIIEKNNINYNDGDGRYQGGALMIRFWTSAGLVNIDNCIFQYNSNLGGSSNSGGAIHADCDQSSGSMMLYISNSTFNNNSSKRGAAVFLRSTRSSIENSTFTNNTEGSTMYFNVGSSGYLSYNFLTNITVAYNSLGTSGYGVNEQEYGYGCGTLGVTRGLMMKNCIFAQNKRTDESQNDFYTSSANSINNGYNLVETQSSTTFTNGVNGCIVGVQANLNLSNTLALNNTSGITPTLALTYGSVAIDAAATGTNGSVNIPTEDQRGVSRGSSPDMGAFEYVYSTPTQQATNINFSDIQYNKLTFSWTNGDGDKRAVFMKQSNTGSTSLVDETTYTANTNFGDGTQIGTSGWFCVYNGASNSVTVTGLDELTDYIVQVFEYNGGTGTELYLNDTETGNPATETTVELIPPTVQASNISFSDVTHSGMEATWDNGNGSYRVAFIKQASSGTATPVNNTTYTADVNFGDGTQIGSTGWFCVYNGSGDEVAITGLNPDTYYILQVFEYNGDNGDETYFTSTATNNPKKQNTVEQPTVYEFTNCSATGRLGPNQSAVNAAYSGTFLDGAVTVYGDGIQQWVVPTTGTYIIEAYGAQGGKGCGTDASAYGGKGAKMSGTFELTQDDTLYIIVGQSGTDYAGAPTGDGTTGAGGGGSFVVKWIASSSYQMNVTGLTGKYVTPLIIAAGGNGGRDYCYSGTGTIYNGVITEGSNPGSNSYSGGSFSTDPNNTYSGSSFLKGGAGALSNYTRNGYTSYAGFGCGGGNRDDGAGGGGGGYWGGLGGSTSAGSYNTGTDQVNESGTKTGHGLISISYIPPVENNLTVNTETTISENESYDNVMVESTGTLTLEAGNTLTISGNFTIESDENGTGSFIDYGTLDVSGDITVQKYLASSNVYGWTVASPVQTAAQSIFSGHVNTYYYNPLTANWAVFSGGNMDLMRGYWTKFNSNHTLEFTDNLNSGEKQYTDFYRTGYQSGNFGWNFIGNPYPSAIDWDLVVALAANGGTYDDFETATKLYPGIYISNNNGGYSSFNDGEGNPPSFDGIIPPATAFWIQVNKNDIDASNPISGAQLTFNNTTRLHENSGSKKSNSTKMRIIIDNGLFTDESLLRLKQATGLCFDPATDTYKMLAVNEELPQIYMLCDDEKLSINAISDDITTALSMPLGIISYINAPHILSFDLSLFDSPMDIYLEDTHNSSMTDLRQQYTYSYQPLSTEENNRFVLHLIPANAGININSNESATSIFSNNGSLYINLQEAEAMLTIYNIVGQEVYNSTINNGLTKLNLNLIKGNYIVNVISSNTFKTAKVFIE